jgi:hypothetical protein
MRFMWCFRYSIGEPKKLLFAQCAGLKQVPKSAAAARVGQNEAISDRALARRDQMPDVHNPACDGRKLTLTCDT